MRQIVAAAALAAALLAPVASADWVEVRQSSRTVDAPGVSWEDGGAVPVPAPDLVEHAYCSRAPREDVCVEAYRLKRGGRVWVETPGVVWRAYELPWYEASAWSPLALHVSCGERDDGSRDVALRGGLDATGGHEYAYRSTTLVVPPLEAGDEPADAACADVDGAGVPERVLP